VVKDNGQVKAVKTALTHRILDVTGVPLVWDVDGRAAVAKGVNPVFSAPSLDSVAVYANDRYWFPGTRHNGSMNVAFVGGHVLTTMRPIQDFGAGAWGFQPID
jgi:prepilin-type processing-associated H-X9-DG protein